MMPSRGARWSNKLLVNGKRPLFVYSTASRHLSSSLAKSKPAASHHVISLTIPRLLRSPLPTSKIILSPPVRYASTTSATLPVESPPTANLESIATSTNDLTPTSLDSITSSDFSPTTEHIGYLKELGLDYGWGPTAFIETLLEHVHIYTGTPWWATIVITALLVRLSLLKAYIGAADTAGRLAVLTPHLEPVKARIAAARAVQDQQALMIATEELRGMFKKANVKMLKLAVPLIQVPLGYGTFRLMRGMAALPVPGLDEGGFLWLKDLTVADPYSILPIVTGFAFYYTFRRGGELGSQTMLSSSMQRFMLYGIPTFSGFLMLFWPGCMQLTFFFTSMLSLTQSTLLRQPWVRNFLGIQPLPPKPSPTANPSSPYAGTMNIYQAPKPGSPPTPENRGLIGGAISDIKGAASQVVKSARSTVESTDAKRAGPRRTKAEMRRAQAYEEQRRRELAQEKFEIEQEKLERSRAKREAQKMKELDR